MPEESHLHLPPQARSDDDVFMVECLTPLRKVTTSYPFKQEYLLTWLIFDEGAPLTVMQIALVRDCLMRLHCEVPSLRPVVTPHPWQSDPPLPSSITIDVSNHHPKSLLTLDGWEIIQRNLNG
jgi:hypothetical protein